MNKPLMSLANLILLVLMMWGFIGNAYGQGLTSVCVFEYNGRPYEWSKTGDNLDLWFYHINESGQAVAQGRPNSFPRVYFYDTTSFFGEQAASFTQFNSSEYKAGIYLIARAFNNDGVIFGDVALLNESPKPPDVDWFFFSNTFAWSWSPDEGFIDLATQVPGISGYGQIGWATGLSGPNPGFSFATSKPVNAGDWDNAHFEHYATPFPFFVKEQENHISQAMLDSILLQCGASPVSNLANIDDSNLNLEFVAGRNIIRYPSAKLGINLSHWWFDDAIYNGNVGQLGDDLNFRVSLNNFGGVDVYSVTTTLEIEGDNDDAFQIYPGGVAPNSVDAGTTSDNFYFLARTKKEGIYKFRVVVRGLDEFNNSFEIKSNPRTYTVESSEPRLTADLKFSDERTRSVVGLNETFSLTLDVSASEGENPIENIVYSNLFANAPNLQVISAPQIPEEGFSLEPEKSRRLEWMLKAIGGGSFRLATTVTGKNKAGVTVGDSDILEGSVVTKELSVEITLSPEGEQVQDEEIGEDPEPIEFTVNAQICNNTDETITDVTLQSLDVKSKHGTALFVDKISGPIPVAEMHLGDLIKKGCVPIPPSKFLATDDAEIEVDALATALSSLGARLTDIDEKYLVIKPKYFFEVIPEVKNPPPGDAIEAGLVIRIGGKVKNLSNTHKLKMGPLYGLLDGNAGAQGFAWNATGTAPDEFIYPDYPLEIEPGGEQEFTLRVNTAASDPRHNGTAEGKPTGGTRAIVKFVPWGVAEHPDGEETVIKPDETQFYNVPDEVKNTEDDLQLDISIKDGIAIPVHNPAAIEAGIYLGAMDATYEMGTGLLTAPFVLLDGFASLLYATGEYQWRLWDSFTDEEKDNMTLSIAYAAQQILLRNYEYAREIEIHPQVLLNQLNTIVQDQMIGMADEWVLGDYTTVATQYSKLGTNLLATVALPVAFHKLGKYNQAQEVLRRAQSAKNIRAASLLRLARRGDDFVDMRIIEEILLTAEAGIEAEPLDLVRIFGYTLEEVAEIQAGINRFPGTMMHTRSKVAASVKWKKNFNAFGKPEPIKVKGTSWLDKILGYPDVYGQDPVGAVVFKKPDFMVLVEQSNQTWGTEILNFLATKDIHPGDGLYDQAVKRLIQRADEWVDYEKFLKQSSEKGWMDLKFNNKFNTIGDDTIALLERSFSNQGTGLGASRFRKFRMRRISDPDSPYEAYVLEMKDNTQGGAWRPITGDVDNIGFTRMDGSALDEISHAQMTEYFVKRGLAEHGDSATAREGFGGLKFIAKQAAGEGGLQELVVQWKAGAKPRLVRFNEKKSLWNSARDFLLQFDGGYVDVGNSVPTQGLKPPLDIPIGQRLPVPAPPLVAKSISAPTWDGSANVGRCQMVYSAEQDASSVIMGSEGRLAEVGADGIVTLSALHDICFGDGGLVTVAIMPSTMLKDDLDAGSTVLPVLDNGSAASTTAASTVAGFQVGQTIVIGADTDHSEIRTVVGLGSLVLDQPLAFDHPVGDVVVVVEQQEHVVAALDEAELASLKSLFDGVSGALGTLQYIDGRLRYSGGDLVLNIGVDDVKPTGSGIQPGAEITPAGAVIINTDQGQTVNGYADLIDSELFEQALAELDLVFNQSTAGRIVVGGALNTGPLYYSMIPSFALENLAPGTVEGISFIPSAQVPNLELIALTSSGTGTPQRQTLFPAPIDWTQMQNGFLAIPGVDSVALGLDGIITIMLDGVAHVGMMDYVVNRHVGEQGQTTIVLGADVNDDSLPDILVTYPDGNEQVMYYLGIR